MPQSINTNISALTAQRNLNKSQAANQTAMNRLSSGLRINSAKDDAAGLSISERMTSQISGLNMAARNSTDGISMSQTAEGGLSSISDSLQRIRELAVQSANASNTDADRVSMQAEASQLLSEVDRVSTQTQFNGRALLDGTLTDQKFQVGANAGQTISLSVASAKISKLGSSDASAITSAQNAGTNALKEGAFSLNGVMIGPSIAAADVASTVSNAGSAIAKAAAVNAKSALSGVTATVNATEDAGYAMTAAVGNGSIDINGVTVALTVSADAASSRAAVVSAINAKKDQTGVTAVDTGDDKGGVKLVAADGRNIQISNIVETSGAINSATTGLSLGATEVAGAAMTPAILTGTLVINGVTTGSITTTAAGPTSRAAVIAGINAIKDQTGVTAVDGGTDALGVKLVAADGRDIITGAFGGTLTQAATGLTASTTTKNTAVSVSTGSFTLNSDKAIAITSNLNDSSVAGGINDSGLSVGTFSTQTAYASSTHTAQAAITTIAAGDFKVNGVLVGASVASSDKASYSYTSAVTGTPNSKATSGIAKAATINAISAQTGVSATANATNVQGVSMTNTAGSDGTLFINGVSTGTITTTTDAAASRKATVDAINAISGQTGVIATDSNDNTKGVTLAAADGRNITVVQASDGGTANLTGLTTGLGGTLTKSTVATADGLTKATDAEFDAGTTTSTITLSSTKAFTIDAGTTTTGTAALNLKVGTYGAGRSGEALDKLDISTLAGANKAMTALDNALNSVNSSRSNMGAIQNRFISVVSNLQSTTENLTASRSRIRDADFASETAELSRTQILQQAGTAMLAQANQSSQGVMALLR